ncbi:MAG: VUT family protein [Pseudomonadota bacterium]
MTKIQFTFAMAGLMVAMATVIVLSNVLVQYPLSGTFAGISLGDLLTWGAFTFPLAFLVTDFANRAFGVARARLVVLVGFAVAVVLSIVFATPRIAIASGSAFLIAQLLDVQLFDRLYRVRSNAGETRVAWWTPPAVSSVFGSVVDTALFFTLAFAAFATPILGFGDAFATEAAPLFGVLAVEAPRWVSWALGDLAVKLIAIPVLLFPYRLLLVTTGLDARPGLAA